LGKTVKTIMIIPGSAGWEYRDMDSGVPLPDRPPEQVIVIRSARLQARLDDNRSKRPQAAKKRRKKPPITKRDWLAATIKAHRKDPGETSDAYAQRLFDTMPTPFKTWQSLRRRLYALAARARRAKRTKAH
jgi:hypothetical protein